MNPELKRHLWQEISLHRLIAMPGMLFLLFLVSYLADHTHKLAKLGGTALTLYVVILLMWGTRNVSACLIDEWRDQTWDQQRMSALSPWTMTWGKLAGASMFQWYGAAFCLAAMLLAGLAEGDADIVLRILSLVALAIMLHATNLAITLHIFIQEKRNRMRNNVGPFLLLIAILALSLINGLERTKTLIFWWQMPFDPAVFWLGSSLLFAAWAVFGAWRVMASALQEHQFGWAWPAFCITLGIYFAGFVELPNKANALGMVLLIALLLTYFGLVSEIYQRMQWQRLLLRWQAKDYRGLLQRLPLWPSSMLLALLCALLLLPFAPGHVLDNPLRFGRAETIPPFAVALMVMRDAALLYFFVLAPNAKRALGTTLLYLALLDGLLPFLASVTDQAWLGIVFFPLSATGNIALIGMLAHFLLAAMLLRWRWKTSA